MGLQDREHLEVKRITELERWLKRHHAESPGLWVVTHKKSSTTPGPSYEEIVCAALCYGWIDSVPGKVDELRSKLYISPRKPKSAWSASNKARVERLSAEGKMQPAGLAAVESAKASGSWDLIDSAQAAEVPADLARAFKGYAGSAANFEAFPKGVRKQILEWIALAKTDVTRNKRIDETARLAAENIRANQWRDPNK